MTYQELLAKICNLCFHFFFSCLALGTAPYFKNCLSAQDLDDLNIEIIRSTLYKSYLEDFYQFCQSTKCLILILALNSLQGGL